MEFNYVGYKQDKKLVWGTVLASSQEAAVKILTSQGTANILSLKAGRKALDWPTLFPSFFRIKPVTVIFFCRQLAMLFESGIDIITALELMRTQETNRVFKRIITEIISDVRSGSR